jgi:single-stranded-DNA-specific exonuclease
LKLISPRWVIPPQLPIPQALKEGFSGSDFLLESLARRGIVTPAAACAFLDFHQYAPANPADFPDMSRAVGRILAALQRQETIGIWGDFDVDGQTSTALLVQTLRELEADCRYHIPIRSRESHGIRLPALKEFLTPNMQVIITCDTGITAHEAAEYLKAEQVDLIITDHHSLPETLPDAFAVINPHLLAPDHPFSSLAGVGVAYLLAAELLMAEGKPERSRELHDLVALGCVADMAGLKADTRYLVQSGLEHMRTVPRAYLSRMAAMLELPLERLNEEHIGFTIAPRMNAVGRLEDANPMVDLLLSEEEAVISPILNRMEALNANRRVLVNQVLQGALAQLDASPAMLDQPLILLSHPEWPAGVVGIAAGRLAELTHHPVILMTKGANGMLQGSARSVEGIDITAALTANRELLSTFGGHPMAAGLSLRADALPEFRARLQQSISEQAALNQVEPVLQVEAALPLAAVDFDLLADLERLSPFGVGNPAPVFCATNLTVDDAVPMGKNSEHRRVTVLDSQENRFEVVWWQGADLPLPDGNFDLAYTAHLNTFKGKASLQFEWVDARPAQEPQIKISTRPRKTPDLVDRRDVHVLDEAILTGLSTSGAQVWGESLSPGSESVVDRLHLKKNLELVILTIPPSPQVLLAGIAAVKPTRITFMGIPPRLDSLEKLLKAVGREIRKADMTEPRILDIAVLASRLNTMSEWALTAVLWFAARGNVQLERIDSALFKISLQGPVDPLRAEALEVQLKKQWDEMAAFRRYYLKAPLTSLIGKAEA